MNIGSEKQRDHDEKVVEIDLSPQLFHHGLSVSHYLYSCLTSFSLD